MDLKNSRQLNHFHHKKEKKVKCKKIDSNVEYLFRMTEGTTDGH